MLAAEASSSTFEFRLTSQCIRLRAPPVRKLAAIRPCQRYGRDLGAQHLNEQSIGQTAGRQR